jgi:SecD/SecF fusion protein
MSVGSDASRAARKAFAGAQAELEGTNIRVAEVKAGLLNPDAGQRKQRLEQLSMGNGARAGMFDRLEKGMQRLGEAEKANDPKAKVDARDDIADVEKEIDESNLPVSRLQTRLEFFQSSIDKLQKSGDKNGLAKKLKEREETIGQFLKKAEGFPKQQQAIKGFVGAFDAYAKSKGVLDDAEDLKRLLRGSGVLEFHIVVTDAQITQSMADRLRTDGPLPKAGDTMRWYEVDRPDQFQGHHLETYGDRKWILAYTTPDEAMVHRENARAWGLSRAFEERDPQTAQRVVGFEFDDQGAVLFGDLSGRNIGKPLGIVLDDKMISAPNLRTQIHKSGQISGNYSDQELKYLIRTLNAGSLPARLADEPISERIVSPTLGKDNLHAGFMSCIVGLVVVGVFLLSYYYFAGSVAMLAVLMNMVIIVGVLAMFGATFTLSGLAGLVLTLGSAVDANVLIFERLREEQFRGLSVRMAIRNAYDRAWSAILDSNVITIITSLVLYYFGSEEVKGFGLTLLIGIASSLFTSLFVTRTIFDLLLEKQMIKKLGSFPLTYPKWDHMLRPNIDWLGKAWIAVVFSVVVLGVGMAMYLVQGRNMYDIEFVSGTSVQFELKVPATREEVMGWVGQRQFEKELPGVQAIAVGGGSMGKEYEIVTPNENSQQVRKALMEALQGKLDVEVPSKFDSFEAGFEQARESNVVRMADEKAAAAYPWARPAIVSHTGGVVIPLNRLDPALTVKEITDRIERARLQPDRANMPYREISVQVPGDPRQATTTALVIVSDEGLGQNPDEGKWQEVLARPMWKLVTEAVNKPAQLSKVSNFNAQVASGTMWAAINALVLSLLLVMVYIWMRFGNMKYGGATVVAMLHDVLFVIGAIGLSHLLAGTWFGREVLLLEPFRMNLTLVAAVLTVMGYSMMDTIVVFDRIRENRGKFGYVNREIINDSINQTLSRTLITGGTTIVTTFVMYVFGGPGLHGFTFALLIGIVVGTYSSIAIAAPILLWGGKDVRAGAAAADRKPAIAGKLQRAGQ